jgi:hypothetical protein
MARPTIHKTGTLTLPSTGGDHRWRRYDYIADLDLDTGLQVVQFYLEEAHLNCDYLELEIPPGPGVAPRFTVPPAHSNKLILTTGATGEECLRIWLPCDGAYSLAIFTVLGQGIGEYLDRQGSAGLNTIRINLSQGVYAVRLKFRGMSAGNTIHVLL